MNDTMALKCHYRVLLQNWWSNFCLRYSPAKIFDRHQQKLKCLQVSVGKMPRFFAKHYRKVVHAKDLSWPTPLDRYIQTSPVYSVTWQLGDLVRIHLVAESIFLITSMILFWRHLPLHNAIYMPSPETEVRSSVLKKYAHCKSILHNVDYRYSYTAISVPWSFYMVCKFAGMKCLNQAWLMNAALC